MYKIDWRVKVGKYRIGYLDKISVHSSVDLLSDTAEISIPGTVINKALEIESSLVRGDVVTIEVGYDDDVKMVFNGYLNRISTDKGNVVLECEDELFLFRKSLSNKEYKNVSLSDLLEKIIQELGLGVELSCDYEFRYDKFVVSRATGYDILTKIHEETRANVYMRDGVLHVHPQYVETFGVARYNFARNIEKDNLTYRRVDELSYEVEVEGVTKSGKSVKVIVGTSGGDRRCIKIYGVTDEAVLRKRGEEELKLLSYDGFEGDFTGWLIPFCEAGYEIELVDDEYEYKNGKYYAVAVTTEVSTSGGVRKVQLGRKIS